MENEKIDYIVVEADYGGLDKISNFIQKKCILNNISFKKSWELMLCIDEICSIIVNYKINEPNIIKVTWEENKNEVIIKIIDDGSLFNPLNVDVENMDYGLGINVIKEMVDKIEYDRKGGFNIITITKSIRRRK